MTKSEREEHDWKVAKAQEEIAETRAMILADLHALEEKLAKTREWIASGHAPFRDEQLLTSAFNIDMGLFVLRARIDAMERFK